MRTDSPSLALTVPGCLVAIALAISTPPARAAFVEIPEFGEGYTIPVAWGDCDGDGDLDLAVGNYTQQNRLYINHGDGSFTAEDQFGSAATFVVVWGDYDNDGDADMAVGNGYGQQNKLYVNQGDGSFIEEDQFGRNRTIAMAWGDCDNDGDLDLAVGNGILGVAEQNLLYINNGDGSFTEEEQFGERQTCSVVWGDYDRDGDLDLAVGNGGFRTSEQNYLYENNGDGTFSERLLFGEENTACLSWADYDNDGDLDLAVGNWDGGQSFLCVNHGDGTFSMFPEFGTWDTNTLAWGDCDNDGWLDAALGNGDFENAEQNRLYVNQGDGTFTEQAEFGEGSTDGVAWGDCDGDGDLDLAAGNEHSPTQNYLYVNHDGPGAYLEVRLVGHFHDLGPGYSNRDGVGARVAAYDAGHVGDDVHLLGCREIAAHGGFASQNAMEAHFGLPGAESVDLRITWPGSGGSRIQQDVLDVAVGQRITIDEEGDPAGAPTGSLVVPSSGRLRIAPHPVRDRADLAFTAPGGRPESVRIFDVGGHAVGELRPTGPDTNGWFHAAWDGRGIDGRLVPWGFYWVRTTGSSPLPLGHVLVIR